MDAPEGSRTIERPGKPRTLGSDATRNIRVDATLTEYRGEQALGRKSVSVTFLGGMKGSVRSQLMVPVKTGEAMNFESAPFNVDAWAVERSDGRIQVNATLEYQGGSVEIGRDWPARDHGIRQSVTVLLESGEPLIVAQSADAIGDRRITLELKATALK